MAHVADHELAGVIESAVSGDEVAFTRIVAAYHEDMRRACVYVTRDHAIADDAVQAAWVVAWRKLASLRQPERLRPWLVSVAVNQATDILRTRARHSKVESVAEPSRIAGGVDPVTGIDLLDAIDAMSHLDPDDRALIAMRYVLGFDATELSAATGTSPAAIRQRLKRLMDRLRRELA